MIITIYLTNYQRNQILDAMLDSNNDLRLWDQKHETFDEYRDKMGVPTQLSVDTDSLLNQVHQ